MRSHLARQRVSRPVPPSNGLGRALRDALRVVDGWLPYQRELHRVPGMSAAVTYDSRIVFERAYGDAVRDGRRRRKVTTTTRYRIASITKVFTATAVMQLVERGILRLDERVQRYLPWFRARSGTSLDAITIRQLLSHTAGVTRDRTDHWSTDRFPTIADLQAYVREGVAVFPPLERWKYSNVGYAILGQVVAAASGQSYEDCVRSAILEPLRLAHTGFALTPSVLATLATGYGRAPSGRAREPFTHPDARAMRAAAGLVSTAGDLCTLMTAEFPGSGRLLTDLSKREMQQPHWPRDDNGHYGLGYGIAFVDDRKIVGHGGGFQGFRTSIGMDPDRRIGVAVLTNAIDGPAGTLMTGVFETIHDCLARAGRPSPGSAARLRRYEGRYAGRWGDVELVTVAGRLVGYDPSESRPLRGANALEARGPGRFQIVDGPGGGQVGETVTFEPNSRGVPTRLRWGPNPMRRVTRSAAR
jgi:CubicO group peptidase (beta-lactamase class C family)